MQIIENWADVVGRVTELHADDRVEGFTVVELDVLRVRPVEGWPNLFEGADGQQIAVSFPDGLIEERAVVPGVVLRCQIRLGGSGAAFVNPEQVAISTEREAGS